MRESVFAQIASRLGVAGQDPGSQLAGLTFLDLYAGSGAMGLEAVSRGASATWVEKDAATARVIGTNLTTLKVSGQVVVADVPRFLARPSVASYDLVWMDPPYETTDDEVARVVGLVEARGWVRSGGHIVVERSAWSGAVEFSESCVSVGHRRYGSTVIYYAKKGSL